MIAMYREDELEQDEGYDDFNPYGLPIRPRIHRGIARPYYPKIRKRKINRVGTRPMSRPKRRRPVKGAMSILLPRKKAMQFGRPRRIALKKSPILKVSPPEKLAKSKKETTSVQRVPPGRKIKAREKAKALKKETAQKEVASEKPKRVMSRKKKILIIGLTMSSVSITGYLIYNAQKKDAL